MANPTQLEVWLQGFPREQVEVRIRELEMELASLKQAMALHDSFSAKNGTVSVDEATERKLTRPDMIRRALREGNNRPMATAEIREIVIAHGWLPNTPADLRRFYAAVSTMNRRGHLLRLQDGRYVLPPHRMEAMT